LKVELEKLKQNILFIINPISGVGRHKVIEKLVAERLDKSLFDYELAYTNAAGHATELSAEAVRNNTDIVVAVGGDGSVNEVGKSLINTTTSMAILPAGSGNGLARHLKIPMDLEKAMEVINASHIISIDTAVLNKQAFIGMAGIGLDAHIGWEFARFGKRGFKSYVKVFFREFPRYKALDYELNIDGKSYHRNAMLISFANGSQYGNNATIAPGADLQDGVLDICILKRFPFFAVAGLAWKLFNNTMDRSKHLETLRGKNISVIQKQNTAHLDGEPIEAGREINISVNPLSLKIIVGKKNHPQK